MLRMGLRIGFITSLIHGVFLCLSASYASAADYSPLVDAIIRNDLAAVTRLIDGGADVNAVYVTESNEEYTPLMAAKDVDMVRLLISKGADVNSKTSQSQDNALATATFRGNIGIVKALLAAGAKVNAKSLGPFGPTTALVDALISPAKSRDLVQLLVSSGADVNAEDGLRKTPLMLASATPGNAEILKILLSNKANVNARDIHGYTALMVAAFRGDAEMITSLIDAGADVNFKGDDGETALKIARLNPDQSIRDILARSGARD